MTSAVCPNCGTWFVPGQNQKFCSASCRGAYKRYRLEKDGPAEYPVHEFDCARCGRHVVTSGENDRRVRFCSKGCEKRFWRHPENKDVLSLGPARLREISYFSYEKYTNREWSES